MDGTIWLWIGFWGMALGFTALAVLSRARDEEAANSSVIHVYVPAIAAVFYLLMALGGGAALVDDGARVFYFARYLDWSVTTPLLLMGLCFTALGSLRGRWALVSALILADVLMVVTGLFAGAAPAGSAGKWIWYVVSCGFFLAVYYVLWGPLLKLARARSTEMSRIYVRNAGLLSVLWFLYPVVFLVGDDGAKLVTTAAVLSAFAILDLLAKVGYGFLAVTQHDRRSA